MIPISAVSTGYRQKREEPSALKEESWVSFTPRYQVITGDDPEMKYQRQAGKIKTSVHWGQRKLGLSIVQFLTNFWDPEMIPQPILLYIGAAPGVNIEFIMTQFFPQFTVHLYDPRPMKVTPTEKMIIHQELFTDEVAQQWTGKNNVFLMSDIRSIGIEAEEAEIIEKGVWEDMLLQARIYETVRPVKAQLKFRLPYFSEGSPRYVDYLYGLVYRGIWAPQSSTETRLVPMENSEGVSRISWDILKYESQLFYHNVRVRQHMKFYNPLVPEDDPVAKEPIDGTELTNDYDSVAETLVWRNYLLKVGGEEMVTLDNIRGLSRSLTKFLAEGRTTDKMLTLHKLRQDPLFLKRLH